MRRVAPTAALSLMLAACGAPPTPEEKAAQSAENAAGMAGPLVELPEGEGGGEAEAPAGAAQAGADATAVASADGWVGRWRGVEGLNLVIAKGDAPGRYRLDMQYSLDDKGVFEGRATDEGIAFERPDGAHVLRPTDGEATGLKWLADKKDCLTVASGEGYCRD